MITSFNQIYNFLSYFHHNKLTENSKILLTIFSDNISDKLISEFQIYIENFAKVEILDMRRERLDSYNFKIRFFKNFFLLFFCFKEK